MQTWHLPLLPATLHWSSLTLALEWRTDCLGVCGDKADIHSIVLGLAHPLEAVGFFFLLLIQQLLLQTPTLEARGLKGGDRHPHFRVCAILLKCPQACDWYSPWQGTNESYGKNNVWKNIALCFLLF